VADNEANTESTAAPAPEKKKSKGKTFLVIAGVVVVLGLAAGAFLVLTSEEEAAAEVYLEPADFLGDDPFSDEPFSEEPPPELATPTVDTIPEAPDSVTIASTSGGEPGLYGGTQDLASCDSQQIVDFLAANPDKAAAWVAALNADPQLRFDGGTLTVADIPDYIAGLTSMVLTADTRVTNHGFVNGTANPIQSVLQAGTAVLVDKYGVPRVKCFCGNPLLPPQAPRGTVTYQGTAWQGFDITNVDVVVKVDVEINNFILTDFRNGGRFSRPAGSNGTNDAPAPGVSTTTTTAPPNTTTTSATSTMPTSLQFTGTIGECENNGTCPTGEVTPYTIDLTCSGGTCTGTVLGETVSFPDTGGAVDIQGPYTVDPFFCDGQSLPTTQSLNLFISASGAVSGESVRTASPVPPNCPNQFRVVETFG